MAKLAINGGPKVIDEAIEKKEWTGPKYVSPLVRMFSQYCGAEYTIPFSSGTAALAAGLIAAGVGPGDEVIVPSFTWPASVNCILHVNGIPVFADIDPKTFTIDVKDVKAKITDRTKAVIPVDIYGHPADIPGLMEIAKTRKFLVVEDACQASGAEINGQKLGNIAHLTAFSFSGKPISSTTGGLLTTKSKELYEKSWIIGEHPSFLSQLDNVELRERYAATLGYGFKFRLDPSAAKIAMESIAALEEANNARIKNCKYLTGALSGIEGITPPYVAPNVKHVYHMYTCLYDEKIIGVPRKLFLKALEAEGVPVVTYINSANWLLFPGGREMSVGPVHLRPVFQEKNLYGKGCPFQCPHGKTPNYDEGTLPITERIVKEEFNLQQSHLSAPYDLKRMQLYVDAIGKVIKNIDELKEPGKA